jgi:hypothetical protein
MPPDISAANVPVGDVAAAIMDIDSFLWRVYADGGAPSGGPDAADVVATDEQARELLAGYCTVIYMLIAGWRNTLNEGGTDEGDRFVLQTIIPEVVTGLRHMTGNVAPSAIPTMAAMLTATALGLSPNRWREQFGEWRHEEMPALQATAALVADQVNRAHDDRAAALRVVMDTLAMAEPQQPGDAQDNNGDPGGRPTP